jgi:hypothetical protein
MASRFSVLQNAVLCLEDGNDSHWLDDGRPNPTAVQKIAGEGIDSIDANELNKFARRRRDVVTPEQIATASAPRTNQVAADRRARTARAALATALQEWQAEFPRMTDEEMRREFIRSNQATLQAIKDGTQQAPTRRNRKYFSCGGARAAARARSCACSPNSPAR